MCMMNSGTRKTFSQLLGVTVACLVGLAGSPAFAQLELFYVHGDHLGTPKVITNQSQQVVWKAHARPFGEVEKEIELITSAHRFPGQHFDAESGLHYNYFRDYDPSLGRYTR